MRHTWESIESQRSFLGDLTDLNGRRLVVLIQQGIAVFAVCTIEHYYMMQDDFLNAPSDLSFQLAASVQDGILFLSEDAEHLFDQDTIEEISTHLYRSLEDR